MFSVYNFFFSLHIVYAKTQRIRPSKINVLATVSLKVVSRKRRRKCTLKSYDRFTNS